MSVAAVAATHQGRDLFKFFRTPLPDWLRGGTVPVDTDSAAIVSKLATTIANLPTIVGVPQPNCGPYISPRSSLYIRPGGSRVPAPLDYKDWSLDRTTEFRNNGVPIPANAVVELPGNSDQALAAWDPAADQYADMIFADKKIGGGLSQFGYGAGYEPMQWLQTTGSAITVPSVSGLNPAGVIQYQVTAKNSNGETTPTSIVSTGNNPAGWDYQLHWVARYSRSNDIQYVVYRKRPADATWTRLRTLTLANSPTLFGPSVYFVAWTDNGSLIPENTNASPPSTNTAVTSEMRMAGGGIMYNASKSLGRFENHSGDSQSPQGSEWGSTATNIPYLAGLVTKDDFDRSEIAHVMTMVLPNEATVGGSIVSSTRHAYPAQAHDGRYAGADATPQGARFRLPIGLAEPTWTGSAIVKKFARMVFRALQRYGIICTDGTTGMCINCRSYTSDGAAGVVTPLNPLGVEWQPGNQNEYDALIQIPWSQLQVVKIDWTG